MNSQTRLKSLFAAIAILSVLAAPATRAVERSEIPDEYKWNLTELYQDEAAWVAAKQELTAVIPKLGQWQGKLGTSSANLLAAMTDWEIAVQSAQRMYVYASTLHDQDTRVSRTLQMKQEAIQVYTDLQTATAYMQPEILAIGKAKVDRFVAEQPKLGQYRMFFDNILRAAPHTLSPAEEKIVAQTGLMSGTGDTVYSVFTGAELPYPEVTLSTGEKVRLDASAYTKYRASPVKADRDLVFNTFFSRYNDFTSTLATTLNAQVQSHVFTKDVRKFPSALEAALFDYNIPKSVYTQLIADVHANLPTLHRYLRLRQKIMGLPELGYEDLYTSIVASVDLDFTPEEARKLTLDSFAPLGAGYVDTLAKGYDSGWVDFMPSTGKRSGAYSTMVYGVHPYQLLNFTGTWEEVSTLAHESGHSMHSYLAAENQPFVTSDYSIFVAEVASTLNENLLFHHVLDQTKDDATRLFLLSSYLDTMRTTLFRQTMFAEFELRIHEAVERGEPLTKDSLNALYLKLLREYYGADQGVVKIADTYQSEWAYIPHFYYDFYVYQYATSMIGGMSLAEGIIGKQAVDSGEAQKNRDAYIRMLSSGSSKYPIELLQDAGVDMTTSRPFDAAMKEMNRIMDEMERIYARKTN
ncbi:MAG: oligoendopeptidase F [Steroidobacteraceae bacterium]|nr:oligoendopeptidase F [Steroidobacteraceae bacterium]